MKKLYAAFTLIGILFLTGCKPYSEDVTSSYVMPEVLAHCSVHKLGNEFGNSINVVYCPAKETITTTQISHKTTKTNVIIQ